MLCGYTLTLVLVCVATFCFFECIWSFLATFNHFSPFIYFLEFGSGLFSNLEDQGREGGWVWVRNPTPGPEAQKCAEIQILGGNAVLGGPPEHFETKPDWDFCVITSGD